MSPWPWPRPLPPENSEFLFIKCFGLTPANGIRQGSGVGFCAHHAVKSPGPVCENPQPAGNVSPRDPDPGSETDALWVSDFMDRLCSTCSWNSSACCCGLSGAGGWEQVRPRGVSAAHRAPRCPRGSVPHLRPGPRGPCPPAPGKGLGATHQEGPRSWTDI